MNFFEKVKFFFSSTKTGEADASSHDKTESVYVLNRESYFRDFEKIYSRLDYEIRHIYQCPLILPFYIPMSDGGCITMPVTEHTAFTVVFNEIDSSQRYSAGIVTNEEYTIPLKKSRVELLLVSSKEDFDYTSYVEKGEKDFRSYLFDTCVDYLNAFITSYRITTKERDIYNVNIPMFQSMSLIRIIDVHRWDFEHSIFMIHHNIPHVKEKLTREKEFEIINYANVVIRDWNPFILSESLMLDSYRKIDSGFYNDAVITAQTSLESMIRTLSALILSQEGLDDDQINTWMEDTPFMSIIKKRMGVWIGGRWDVAYEGSEVYNWYEKGYRTRNRIIHTGKGIDKNEAIEAVSSINTIRGFVISKLRTKPYKYPDFIKFFEKE